MIIIINGSVGVGKSSAAWEVAARFDTSFMFDGDYIGAVHPFEIYDQARVNYLYKTICHLIKFHQHNGYTNFVINYVFEDASQLTRLIDQLQTLDPDIHTFWLTCDEAVQTQRVVGRKVDHAWDLERFVELNRIQRASSLRGFIGREIDTSYLSVEGVADHIWKVLT